MFAECVSEGAAFGFKAFFALAVFLLCCGAALGLLVLIGKIIGGDDDKINPV